MFGVTLGGTGVKGINELGYKIVENSSYGFSTVTAVVSKKTGKIVAGILLNKTGNLQVTIVGAESLKDVKDVSIYSTKLPKKLLFEINTNSNKKVWCEYPLKDNQPIFWKQ